MGVRWSEVAADIERRRVQQKIPGLSITVATDSEIIWGESFGATRRSGRIPINERTLFSIQSASKMYTATGAMVAVEEGLLDLDLPIAAYLPNFKVNTRFEENPSGLITLRHLLSHRAGFTHEAPVGNNYDGSDSFDDHIRSISRTWLRFPVRAHNAYSNLGFDLAGYIIQVRSGMPFAAYMRSRLFEPLMMARTTFDIEVVRKARNRAIGDSRSGQPPLVIPMIPSGGLYTCTADVARFLAFHLNGGRSGGRQVISKSLLEEMYAIPWALEGQAGGYGLGVARIRRKGRTFLGHGGGGFGFLCDIYWSRESGVGVCVLTNSTDHSLQGVLAFEIFDDILGSSEEELASGISRSVEPAELPELLGSYVGRGGILRFEQQEGTVGILRAEKFEAIRFVSSTDFYLESDPSWGVLRFLGTESEGPAIINLDSGETWIYNDGPKDVPGPDDPRWEEFVGQYAIFSYGVLLDRVSIQRRNGYLYFGPHLKLTEQETGLFFSSTGEALDLRGPIPSYANIALVKQIDREET